MEAVVATDRLQQALSEYFGFNSFKDKYKQSLLLGKPSFLEAFVVGRDLNVKVHAEITKIGARLGKPD